ncbi:MAG: NADPH:quinone reductase [Deltaproteobacteria bacterium]|nr:NADPH:quinone reductase [Deltaproteobacteria bacterium]
MLRIAVSEFGEPEVMKLEEASLPEAGPGQVVVSIKAAGVNPVDTYIRAGLYGTRELPYTPGFDAGGVVEAVGKGATRFKPGDRVYTAGTLSGAYAQFALCLESQVRALPEKITFSQGAAIGVPYATAYRALFQKARAVPGETVLIHGATGGVGTAAVQMARASGMVVIGTAGTKKGRDLARENGAHHVVEHGKPDHLKDVMEITGGRGVDCIIEFLANVNLGGDLKTLAGGGRVVVVGSRGAVEIDPRDAMGKDAVVLGMSLFNATETELKSIHAAIFAGLDNGTLNPVVGLQFPLAQAPEAHHAVMEQKALGKIVLVP